MLLPRRIRFLRRNVYAYSLVAGIILLCVYTKLLPVYLEVQDLLNSGSCPACYATNLCPNFESGEFELVGRHTFYPAKFFNERNVFEAAWRPLSDGEADWRPLSHAVVLKKLGTDLELSGMESELCKYLHTEQCNVGQAIEGLENQVVEDKSDLRGFQDGGELSSVTINIEKLKSISVFQDIDILRCVNDQDLMDFLVHKSLHHTSLPHIHNLLTILLVNQEPVISMAFPGHKGWPFPQYYGGCGRVTVFQYIGESFDSYYNHPWILRAHFALQLLNIAQQFSKNQEEIALYPTDWSANNFVVDWSTKQLFLVDMENIIIVNQTRIKHRRAPGWDVNHVADRFGCQDCFSFHAQDLCTHVYTDHNYHGVCGGILSKTPYSPGIPGGILHTTPTQVVTRHPELQGLIEECAVTSKPGGREQTAQLIMEILQAELQDQDLTLFD